MYLFLLDSLKMLYLLHLQLLLLCQSGQLALGAFGPSRLIGFDCGTLLGISDSGFHLKQDLGLVDMFVRLLVIALNLQYS